MKILFAASEAYPLVKTGGLGDVIHALPRALRHQGEDVRVILPAYRSVLERLGPIQIRAWLEVQGACRQHTVRVLETQETRLGVPLLLIDAPALFDRHGGPYLHPDGHNWHDNAERFAVFSRAVAKLACRADVLDWQPDVVHCHDWQTGLVPAFLKQQSEAPASVYTIHNLSYAGVFSHEEFLNLALPGEWWSPDAVEFYGNFSMLKAGIVFSDKITTVSPTYAREIQTPAYGYGFDGILRAMSHKLVGILNGIDTEVWDPAHDPYLPVHYTQENALAGKQENKRLLLEKHQVTVTEAQLQHTPLLGFIGRLVEQKGVDLLLHAMPQILDRYPESRFVLLGSGERHFEDRLRELAAAYPQRVLLTIGYCEETAHRIEAAADLFIMPSRFEPCGLNQLYSLRYGTPPVVHRVGGLADTVEDYNETTLTKGQGTGFVFDAPTPHALLEALHRAMHAYAQKSNWQRLVQNAMRQDFAWTHSAHRYQTLYREIVN